MRQWLGLYREPLVVIDKLTYAGNVARLKEVINPGVCDFIHTDIGDAARINKILHHYQPRAIINFAAETHVDRSLNTPEDFMKTNVMGTWRLLDCALSYWSGLSTLAKANFRFVQISTDEVYGALSPRQPPLTENHPFKPNNPYAASKAAADHSVRAYHKTYGLPTLITHGTNTYGPYQFPEKLIPLCLTKALRGEPIPLYGHGQHIRDWLHVADHSTAILAVLDKGLPGESYNISGQNEKTNLDVVESLCFCLDELLPRQDGVSYAQQIVHVQERLGHDYRYALNAQKLRRMTKEKWQPQENFKTGLYKTVQWHIQHAQEAHSCGFSFERAP